jgi:hypothetical protein
MKNARNGTLQNKQEDQVVVVDSVDALKASVTKLETVNCKYGLKNFSKIETKTMAVKVRDCNK